MTWKRLMPRTLTMGLKGKTKSTQPLHSPAFSVTFCPDSSIVTEVRSFETVTVMGMVM